MKNITKLTFAAAMLALLASCGAPQTDYCKWVDPGIGTAHSRWFFFTPAAVPFGMAKAAPSTDGHYGNPGGWQAVGYDARHTSIEGFANLHEFQVGGVVLAPTTGELQTVPGVLEDVTSGYRSNFDKADEIASPGYYSVILKDYGIKAELTATERVAFHRYTYPAAEKSNLIFDMGNRQGESGFVKDASVTYTEDGRIEGFVTTMPVYINIYQQGADLTMYFSIEPAVKPESFGSFNGAEVHEGERSATGVGAGIYFTFPTTEGQSIDTKVGLSYTSVENARANLLAEAGNLSFDNAHKKAVARWNDMLGRIAVEGGTDADMTKFYTGLFHALLGRGLASDVNGAYPAHDGSVGQIPLGTDGKPKFNHYNTDAIWGGFWNLTQLWTMAYPEYYADWVSSQLLVYDDAGWLGDGIACSKYVSGVGTNFTGLAIAAAYNAGIRNFDVEKGYQAALKNEIESEGRPAGAGKLDVGLFVKYGYSPYADGFHMQNTPEGSGFCCSHTLEYSFSCAAVAQMAKALGHDEDYARLTGLSKGWKKIFDPEVRLMRPRRADGTFIEDFDPRAPWIGFQEGNAVQYTWYVPHDAEELVDLLGAEEFCTRLDNSFEMSRANIFGGGQTVDAFAGLNAVYNHGNQPNLHISWMFNFAGKPWLSQKWVRAILDEFYGTEPIHGYGYGQDEDQGQLGAWYVISSLGLFDVKGLTAENPSFQIGSPVFDKVTIKLNPDYCSGKTFTIEAVNNSKENVYIQNASLNGSALERLSLPLEDFKKGGTLTIELGPEANEQ
ncbi:MAG: glycoside hydrolase family 92 protein [Bacteroidales bacterium]|nr:glycoside hydrolase family 92 protein [Bacteroidales bacterium]